MHSLSIIIPAYNESHRIKNTLFDVYTYLKKNQFDAEILIVNDGSTDNTKQIVNQAAKKIPILKSINYTPNQGKGQAVKTGLNKASKKYSLIFDADQSISIKQIKKMLSALQKSKADIAIGSRYLQPTTTKAKQPLYRIAASRIGYLLNQKLLNLHFKDTQCGFKLFKTCVAKEIIKKQTIKRFYFDAELLVIAQINNYKIIEVPIAWHDKIGSRVKPIRDAYRNLRDTLRIAYNLKKGKYK